MARLIRLLLSTLPLIFSVLAFAFSIVSTTSREWSQQTTYSSQERVTNWTAANALYTIYRSPFVLCSAYIVPSTTNASDSSGNDDDPIDPTFGVNCTNFKPYGFAQTSCELAIAVTNDTYGQVGDARLCQQIHYAGNFAVAGSVFLGLGLLLTMGMFIATMHVIFPLRRKQHNAQHPKVEGDAAASKAAFTENTVQGETHERRQRRFMVMSSINLVLVLFLVVGILLTAVAQFYGVLAFIQSSVNNADFATKGGNKTQHGPWIQGRALSVYATLGWAFAGLAAVGALSAWRLPKWDRVL
ncbi:hypothetical protein MMC11_005672 [Xylographa trunciseda]|nr:hypothetical protein [Xylographa trunciseda]